MNQKLKAERYTEQEIFDILENSWLFSPEARKKALEESKPVLELEWNEPCVGYTVPEGKDRMEAIEDRQKIREVHQSLSDKKYEKFRLSSFIEAEVLKAFCQKASETYTVKVNGEVFESV